MRNRDRYEGGPLTPDDARRLGGVPVGDQFGDGCDMWELPSGDLVVPSTVEQRRAGFRECIDEMVGDLAAELKADDPSFLSALPKYVRAAAERVTALRSRPPTDPEREDAQVRLWLLREMRARYEPVLLPRLAMPRRGRSRARAPRPRRVARRCRPSSSRAGPTDSDPPPSHTLVDEARHAA